MPDGHDLSRFDKHIGNEEAKAILGIGRTALQALRSTGRLRYALVGNRCLYLRSDVEGLLQPRSRALRHQVEQ